jgi:hypothetical protein
MFSNRIKFLAAFPYQTRARRSTIAAKDVKNYADAQVSKSRGVLVCSTIDADKQFPGNGLVKMGNYHNLDYALYYNNIRDNAANRAERFLNIK